MKNLFSFWKRLPYDVGKCLLTAILFAISGEGVFAQQKSITGTVRDKSGESLIGVSVLVENTTNRAITDFDGKYSIQASEGDVLSFTYIGMETQRATVSGSNIIDITLQESSTMLGETVVIGYGSAKKRDLTGSITSIKGAEVANRPASNPLASIQGKVAGIQITNSGQAGAEPDIRIRGTNSINGAKPLYIVDGLFNDNINFLNPADIESMEVLKDPSSLAIFGVRGANGVIIITTKTAKQGKVTVNLNATVSAKHVPHSMRMNLTDAPQFIELYNEQLLNQGITTPYDYTHWQANTDWQDEIFQTGLMSYDNISISGATDRSKFYMGVGYMYEDGIIKHERMDKISLNLNSEFKVTEGLKFGFQVNGYKANPANSKSVSTAIIAAPIAPVRDKESGLYHTLPDFQRSQVWNPMIDIDLQKNTRIPDEYRIAGSVYGDWTFLKDFNFRASFFADYGFNQTRNYSPLVSVFNPDLEGYIDELSRETSINQSQNMYTKLQSDFTLSYKKQLGDHGLTLTAGFTTYYNTFSEISGGRKQYEDTTIPNLPKYWYLSMGDPSEATNGSSQWETATASLLFRGLYNYKDKYLVNASYRLDGASAFAYNGNTWENFGAIGLAWVLSEENFMQGQSAFDYLKLKGSWGVLGSQNIDPSWRYPGYPEMENTSTGIFGDAIYPGYTPKYLPDPDLHWERIYSWEVGVDGYSLKNRLHYEAAYFHKMTKGFLAIVPGVSGTVPGLSNLGDIENQGVELSLSWSDQVGDWNYSVSGNLTTLKNKVFNYDNIVGMSRTSHGRPIGYFYGYKVIGVYQTDAEIAQSPQSKIATVHPGDLKFADTDNDGFITTNDRTMIGNPTPDFTYGGTISVGYKGIDLSVDVMGAYGNEIFRNWNRNAYAQFNYQTERLNRWHGAGTSNWEPILNDERSNNREISSYYIEDGSYFRIRNIQLGYNFSKKVLQALHMQNFRIYLNAQNPVTFKNNTGYTPEIGGSTVQFGVDNGTYPIPTIYTFGINLTF